MTPRSRRHTVVALIPSSVSPFELAVACEVFGIERPDLHDPWYRFYVATPDGRPADTPMGMRIDVDHDLSIVKKADTILVPASAGDERETPEAVLDAIRAAHARGTRLLSVCSGAFVLARAGVLDGRRATTHWMHTTALAVEHPLVKVDEGVLYVDDGDIITSAGTAAGIDMCLHVVRKDFGAGVANALARRMVVPPHREGGQAQFIEDPVPVCPDDDPLTGVLAWIGEHLNEALSVDEMAREANMSPRHFARRFRAATGTTPHQWLLNQRILLVQRLLETTDKPVEQIADLAGFGSAAALRLQFQRAVRTTPTAYRRTFRRRAA